MKTNKNCTKLRQLKEYILILVISLAIPCLLVRPARANDPPPVLLTWGGLSNPLSIDIDGAGNSYVVDLNNHQIKKFDTQGNLLMTWGGLGNGEGQFNTPTGIAVDIAGNVYVADSRNYRIQKFDSTGNFITQWGSQGSDEGQFREPVGVAADLFGNIYVVDSNLNRLQKFDNTGGFIFQRTGFSSPQGVEVDDAGNIYVADTVNAQIQKFDSAGTFITSWGSFGTSDGQFSWPHNLGIDRDGNLYVADRDNHRIQKFDNQGNFLTKWGTNGSGLGQFSSPVDVVFDIQQNSYVVDSGNNRIVKLGLPTITFSDSRYLVNEEAGPAVISMTVSPAVNSAVQVNYQTTDGSATAGVDYQPLSTTLLIPANTEVMTVSLPITGDRSTEGNETINMSLSNPLTARLGGLITATLTIVDDDLPPGTTVTPTMLTVSEPAGTADFTLKLNSPPTASVTISLTPTNTECAVAPTSVTFEPLTWNTIQTATVSAVDDSLVDGDQTCLIQTVAVSRDSLYDGLEVADVTVTVSNDDVSPPTLSVAPTRLFFEAVENTNNPLPQTIRLSNSGPGVISWTVSVTVAGGRDWLTVTPLSGTVPATLTASVETSGLTRGSYTATILIDGGPVDNSPQQVEVTLNINPPVENPLLQVNPTSLTFTALQGGANPADQTLTINNGSTGIINWSAQENIAWLSLDHQTGTAPSTVTVSVDLTSLTAGSYNGDITIDGGGVQGSPQTVPVTLTVAPSGEGRVRMVHAAPFASGEASVRLVLDGTDLWPDFNYQQVQDYTNLAVGSHTVEIFLNPTSREIFATQVAISTTFTVEANQDYTLIVIGDGNNQPLDLLWLRDDNRPPNPGQAKLRLVHTAPFTSGQALIDLVNEEGNIAIVEDVPYGIFSPFVSLEPNTYNFKLTTPDDLTTVLIDAPPVVVEAGNQATILAIGDGQNQPPGILLIGEATIQEGRQIFLPVVRR